MYAIKLTAEAIRQVKALPKKEKNALRKELTDRLAADPIGCSKPLLGLLEGFRSFRWRNRRIVFRLYEELGAIAIVAVGERRPGIEGDVYQRLEETAKAGRLAEIVLRAYRDIGGLAARTRDA